MTTIRVAVLDAVAKIYAGKAEAGVDFTDEEVVNSAITLENYVRGRF